MATFTALNIIPDENPDDEVDNTKEIQIEEALKLYQTALKYHSQGPRSFNEAAEAYTKLFQSEIFSYPESETEFTRVQNHPELEYTDGFGIGLDLAAAGVDGAPSTLPQILYLSYKNHGQFILDCVKGALQLGPMHKPALDYQTHASITNFCRALVSDESDTELWRKVARVAAMMGSRRVQRYCLEAAVEVDDDPTVAEVDPLSLEEGFAGEQLKEVLNVLGDKTALSHPIIAPYLKKTMPQFLTSHMDPYPFLRNLTKELTKPELLIDRSIHPVERIALNVDFRTWTALGDKLCENYLSPLGMSGSGVVLELPEFLETMPSIEEEVPHEPSVVEDQVMKDAVVTESPVEEAAEPPAAEPVTAEPEEHVEIVTTTTTVPLADERRQSNTGLPTRKRSQSAAGIRETPEDDSGTQKRSKRVRNRENTTEGPIDPAAQFAEKLQAFVRADEDVFSFVHNLLSKLGVKDLGTFQDLQKALAHEERSDRTEITNNTAVRDLRDILRTWDESKASTFVNGNAADILGSSASSANAGLAAFLEHSKSGPLKPSKLPWFDDSDGIPEFAAKIDAMWMPLQDVIWEWLRAVLPTYRTTLWPEITKVTVVRIISYVDSDIFTRLKLQLEHAISHGEDLQEIQDMTETLFELHIDIYSRITNPNSAVPYETRIMTKDRLDRWADFAADVIRSRSDDSTDELAMRYLWASVFYATMADSISREHKVCCWSDLQKLLADSGQDTIELQNNAVMPEISVAAAEREVSRLTTMDFFFNLFQTDRSDPIAIIETLEPVLDPDSACNPTEPQEDEVGTSVEATDNAPATLRDMWKFLKSGSTSLRLFLWQRLRDAYTSINYTTKVFSCQLKSIEIIVGDLRTEDFVDSLEDPRRHKLLLWLKALDDLLVKALSTALNDAATCFEIIDERHLKSTCAALAQLSRLLHAAALFDDELRVGMIQLPQNPLYHANGSFIGFTNKLREMQVRTWALQYTMIKEAMSQNIELFTTPDNDLADYLALVHYCLGMRKSCKASNKIFLKMMKVEMIRLKHVDKWEDYLGQVLYDLYGIRLGVGTYLLDEHGCPVEPLDRRTVLNIADQVITLANRIPMKDLLKHELRPTIERMQTAVGPQKSTPQMQHNMRNYTEYMKTSIRPLDLYKAWMGQVQVDSLPVDCNESVLADKGWYFLLGMIALTKYRSQKRLSPGAQTDDLRVAASFFRLQLQFGREDWETWFRLAQCFDYDLEEEILWTSDKLNNNRAEIVKLQRGAIHCYIMALSTAMRSADDSFETASKLSEMYYDFGMRIYASSREPFGMEAFWVDDFEKHMSGSLGMYKKPLHDEMSRYRAWKYASKLFRESLKDRPMAWMNHFMLGKCLWKMYCKADDEFDQRLRATKPTVDSVIFAFTNAVETVPKPRDSRSEPILEPHYKIVSIMHKLVMLRAVSPSTAAEILQQQPYAPRKGETISIADLDDWEPYILECLRTLRSADKQHWQHRIAARSASIIFDEGHPDYVAAQGAIAEFRESIFTKTMQIQVWKPEAERAGRHCVYMERYVKFMNQLLATIKDKSNMEAMIKRVRKKANDFYRFEKVWTESCTIYLRLIRHHSDIAASMDDVLKGVAHDEYDMLAERLQIWIDQGQVHPALDALKEASELKKLNAGLMKSAPIDDLINDAYATLYMQVAKQLPGPDVSSLQQAQLDGGDNSTIGPRPAGPMSLNNLVMDMNGTQIAVPVTFAGSEPARQRRTGISRREVLRRAELLISRLPDPPRAIAPATSRSRISEPAPNMILGSNAEPKQRSASAAGSTPRVQQENAEEDHEEEHGEDHEEEHEEDHEEEHEEFQHDEQHEEERGEERRDDESERGSLHDSADDESDLSDVPDMDDVDSSTIFPNMETRGSSGGEGGSAGEGEGEE